MVWGSVGPKGPIQQSKIPKVTYPSMYSKSPYKVPPLGDRGNLPEKYTTSKLTNHIKHMEHTPTT